MSHLSANAIQKIYDENDIFSQIKLNGDNILSNLQEYQSNYDIEVRSIDPQQEYEKILNFKEINNASNFINRRDPKSILLNRGQKNKNQYKKYQQSSHEQMQKQQFKDSKRNVYAKNYRQKKKQQLKVLQEQNRYLKQKVDDLSFRLKQTQIQLNKLKHNSNTNNSDFHSTKSQCLRQIQRLLSTQKDNNNNNAKQIYEISEKLSNISDFSNKQKLDLLNYFMNQLLQNIVDNMTLYFIDSLISNKGMWRQNQNTPLRLIDQQVFQIYGIHDKNKLNQIKSVIPEFLKDQMKRFKNLWKKLYQDYLQLLQSGLVISTLCKPIEQKLTLQKGLQQRVMFLKLELYFQKTKYRKDIRQIRESWFRQFEEDRQKTNHTLNLQRKNKLIKK